MQKFQTKLKELWEKVKGFFKKLNKTARILLGVCLVVVLAVIIFAVVQMNKKEYATLCTGLTASETSTIVKFLSDNGVTDYQIKNDSILVPAGRETQLQTQLVLSGNLNSGFLYPYYTDNIGLTSTSSEEEQALRISVEQRLESIIQMFDGVRDAWVQITPGEKQVYVLQDSATPAKVSVTITPDGNRQLDDNVVKAIRDTVCHSVARLSAEDVSVNDIYGNPYSDNSTLAQSGQATALKLEHEERINNNVRSQILQTLGPIYGYENVSVGVISTVEVSRKYRDSTFYNQPEGSVKGGGLVSEDHLFQEVIRDGSQPTGGTVGTTSNSDIPIQPDLNSSLTGDEDYAGNQVDRYHNIDTTNEQEEILEGRLADLRVTVSVNQNCPNAGAMTIDALRDSVATLAGVGTEGVEAAQQRVFVTIAPFNEDVTVAPGTPGWPIFQNSWVLYAAIGGLVLFLILLLVIILLLRRNRKKKLARQQALEEEMALAAAEAEAAAIIAAAPPTGGADIMEVNTEKSMELRKTVRQFAQNNPEIAAQMVKAWLKGDDTGG
ncbi:flagellar basal-body MS-ring/collar protein FliF [Flintibacter muris]|uniref:flagellar basal-body MS-ring/collar protein FliF n=1 Tax=Flintibacter muris TaxID=2941327 RepID=UPI00203DF636|nr:flagellar basal-body MS-ring/collar protein FliF [Flintibacter muris]